MLKQQIQGDVISAMKQGNQEVASVLRMAIAALNAKEKEKRHFILGKKMENLLVLESQMINRIGS